MRKKYLLFIACLCCCFSLKLQAQQERPITYAVVNYMKVLPENEGEYLTLERSVFRKLHKERIAKGQLFGWYLFQVLSPFGDEMKYNYVTVDMYLAEKGLQAHFESWDIDFEKILTEEELNKTKETDQLRTILKREVFEYRDGVWKDDYRRPAKFTVINYMKLKPDLISSNYDEMENKFWKPIHAENIKSGHLASWALYYKQMPMGNNEAYDAATVDSYDNFNHTLINNYEEVFSKVHPDKNATEILKKTNAARSLVKREVRLLVDFVQ